MKLTEDEKVFGNVTWKDIFSRQYWDVGYIHKEIPWKGERIGKVTTRQEYPRDVCLKIIDRILDDYEKARQHPKLIEENQSLKYQRIDLINKLGKEKKLRELIEKTIKDKKKLELLSKSPVYALYELEKLLEENKI